MLQKTPGISHDLTLSSGGHLQRFVLAALLHDATTPFHKYDGRDQHVGHVLDGRGDRVRSRPCREVLQSSRRIDEIHTRSLSRGTDVSIPLRKPRIFRIGCTGMNSARFCYWSTCTFWPGCRRSASRISRGITT